MSFILQGPLLMSQLSGSTPNGSKEITRRTSIGPIEFETGNSKNDKVVTIIHEIEGLDPFPSKM